jgi:MFS family permease
MFSAQDVPELEQTIQLAIAPAFLLTGIFSALNVLAGRLARLIDWERAIRNGLSPALAGERRRLAERAWHIHRAITCCVLAAMALCTLIVLSFGAVFLGLAVAWVLAGLLIGAMLLLVAALGFFLAEVRIASHHLPLTADEG